MYTVLVLGPGSSLLVVPALPPKSNGLDIFCDSPGFQSLQICANLQDFYRSLQICVDLKKNDLFRNTIETPQQCQTNNKNV